MRHNERIPGVTASRRSILVGVAVVGLLTVPLTGCAHHTSRPISLKTPSLSTTAAPAVAPLPAPEAIVDVLTRLSDPDLPSAQKVGLVQTATGDSIPLLDKYTIALRDSGYLPMSFTADHLAWSDQTPTDVTANVTISSANKRVFTFPMEFTPSQGGWQLSRKTADMLLAFGDSSSNSSATTPTEPAQASSPTAVPPG